MKAKSFNRMGISMIICCMLSWSFFSFYVINSYQIFVPAIAEARGIEFADLNMWNTYGGLVACVGTVIAGYVVRRTGPKWCMAVALILAGANYALIPSYPTVLLGLGIAINAIAQVFYCNLPTNVLMANWYPRKNAVVMGWVTGAIVLGGVLYLPVFNSIMGSSGLATAMRLFGIVVIVFGVACVLWVKNKPEEVGLEPDGIPMSEEERQQIIAKKNEKNPWTIGKVFSNKRILAFSIAWGLSMLVLAGVQSVGIPILVSKGVEQAVAVKYATFGAVLNLIGSVLSGMLADKIGTMKAGVVVMGLQLACALLLAMGGEANTAVLLVGYVVAMTVAGAPSNMIATGALRLIGARYFTVAWGTMFGLINLFRAFASSIISMSLKMTESYNTALFIFAGMMALGIILSVYAGEKYQEPPVTQEMLSGTPNE